MGLTEIKKVGRRGQERAGEEGECISWHPVTAGWEPEAQEGSVDSYAPVI